jgi:hypothetical protein
MSSNLKIMSTIVGVASLFGIVGCGGSGGSNTSISAPETATAFYVDGPVSGVQYRCGTQQNGLRDAECRFTFEIEGGVYIFDR